MALPAVPLFSGSGNRGRGRSRGGRRRSRRGRSHGSRGNFSGVAVEELELQSSSEEDNSSLFLDILEELVLESGGYDYDFINDVPASLQCLICTLPARDAQQVDCCGKIFCQSCLTILMKSKNVGCPNCRNETFNTFADKRSDRDILSLTVKCKNYNGNCSWTGELRDLEKHLQHCLHPCKYASLGCLVRMRKEDLVVHEEECILERFKVVMERLLALEMQVMKQLMQTQSSKEVMPPSNLIAPLTFQFKYGREGTSVPFYSHPNGYKFVLIFKCTLVQALNLSIKVHIMHGEYDDYLAWPFRGVITFEMLDQEDDRCHKRGSAMFKERKVSVKNNRVPPGQEKNEEGWGEDLLIDRVNYVKEECIYIRVKEVVVEGLNKPWLSDRLVVVSS